MTTKSLPSLRDSKGPIATGKLLGKGGEGSVFEIVGSPDCVAKIYHKPASPEKSAKIESMVTLKSDRLLTLAAWPLDLLRTPEGQAMGLVMPKVDGPKDIHTLYSPRNRKAEFPDADWRFLVRSAANTARAFAAIHDIGCVIGDVNPGGVRVSNKATVRLIDCDSFQITDGARKFLCEVGVPTFTPPELQGKPFRGVVRTPNHDNFGLAILVFHLLYMGRHPFAARFLGRGDMSIEQAISEFRFAYGANRASYQMEPPPNVPAISIASQQVTELFERAMAPTSVRDGARPTAPEWTSALEALEKQLKVCHVNASHHFYSGLDHCPWCRLEAATGVVLFNSIIQRAAPSIGGDIAAAWVLIIALKSPGQAPELTDWKNIAPNPNAVALGRSRRTRKLAANGAMLIALLTVITVAPFALIIWLIGGIFIWKAVWKWSSSDAELESYKAAERGAEEQWKNLKARWDQEASDQRFATQLRQLEHERNQLRELPSVRQRRYQELERNREQDQRRRHLERFEIEKAKIPGVGPSRKVMLQSYNIETAWDVSEARIVRVPGFGPALTRELVSWRGTVEGKFRFDASMGVDPQDIAALDREITDTKRKLELNINNGPQALNQIRAQILAQRTNLMPFMEGAAKALAQAKANLRAAA